jgi:hypothetical protein
MQSIDLSKNYSLKVSQSLSADLIFPNCFPISIAFKVFDRYLPDQILAASIILRKAFKRGYVVVSNVSDVQWNETQTLIATENVQILRVDSSKIT